MMSLENNKYKNRWSIFEIFTLGVSVLFTKLFYPKAKLVCYPVYMRGKKSIKYGKGLNIGYGCRFDLLNTEKITLTIGENCEMGDSCHIVATNEVRIGKNFLCASKVFISDTNHGNYRGENCSLPSEPPKERTLISDPVFIGDNVWVGDNAVILPGTKIGNGCIVGANALVSGVFDDNCIIAGVPAKIVKRYDKNTRQWVKIV